MAWACEMFARILILCRSHIWSNARMTLRTVVLNRLWAEAESRIAVLLSLAAGTVIQLMIRWINLWMLKICVLWSVFFCLPSEIKVWVAMLWRFPLCSGSFLACPCVHGLRSGKWVEVRAASEIEASPVLIEHINVTRNSLSIQSYKSLPDFRLDIAGSSVWWDWVALGVLVWWLWVQLCLSGWCWAFCNLTHRHLTGCVDLRWSLRCTS